MDVMDTDKQVSVTKTHTQNQNPLIFLNSVVFYGILASPGEAVDVLFWALSLKAKSSKPKKKGKKNQTNQQQNPEGQLCLSSKIYFTESKHVKNASKLILSHCEKSPVRNQKMSLGLKIHGQ